MKNRGLLFALVCLSVTSFGLTSCTNDKNENGGGNNAGKITKDTKFVLNASNVASYFDIDVSDARKSYDTGYVFRYKIYVETKGRYKTSGKVSLSFKVSFKYTYKPRAAVSNRTLTSTGSGTLTLESNQIYGYKEFTVTFSAHVDKLISCSCLGYFTAASGNLVKY